jgi:translation initiation factor 2 subunit 3
MLNGAAVMDAAVLVVAANEHVPQPQTMEHLVATEIMNLRNIITVQNKVDLVTKQQAMDNKTAIERMLEGSSAQGCPVIPISCAPKFNANIDVLLQYIATKIPVPVRDLSSPVRMKIIRTFDVNTPGTPQAKLKGGVCGGSIECGILRVGEIVEIKPGIIYASSNGPKTYKPLVTRVEALFSESRALQLAVPGGLIGVGTKLDPVLTGKDRLVGHVLGRLGTLPNVYSYLTLAYKLLRTVVGDQSDQKVQPPVVGEEILLTIGSASVRGRVVRIEGTKARGSLVAALADPVCAAIGEKVSLSKKVNLRFRLAGCCTVNAGKVAPLKE